MGDAEGYARVVVESRVEMEGGVPVGFNPVVDFVEEGGGVVRDASGVDFEQAGSVVERDGDDAVEVDDDGDENRVFRPGVEGPGAFFRFFNECVGGWSRVFVEGGSEERFSDGVEEVGLDAAGDGDIDAEDDGLVGGGRG